MRATLWIVLFGSVLGGLLLIVVTRTVNGGVVVLAITTVLSALALLALDERSRVRR